MQIKLQLIDRPVADFRQTLVACFVITPALAEYVLQRIRIDHPYLLAADIQNPPQDKTRHYTADRFDLETEIARDLAARHRQANRLVATGGRSTARREIEQKMRSALLRRQIAK